MPITVHLFADHESASQAIASRLSELVRHQPTCCLALPSGQTPLRAYALLAAGDVDFSRVTVFALDEYVDLPADDARSFAAFFARHVFGPLRIAPERAHCLDGRAADPRREAARYEAAIARAGGLDLTLLGLGANGHIAFNEPADTLIAATHLTPLAPPAAEIAPVGLTMGVGTLLAAPRVWLLATGAKKACAVAALLSGRVDPHCPASMLALHPAAEVFVDGPACAMTPPAGLLYGV